VTDTLPWDTFTQQQPVLPNQHHPVLIIGAGLAGCWMARTLAEAGIPVLVLDSASEIAAGASSNPTGIVKPFVTRRPGLAMLFYVQAHQYLLKRLEAWELRDNCSYTNCGVVQLVDKPYPDSVHYQNITADDLHSSLGTITNGHGLLFENSGWLNPSALCARLLDHARIILRTDCEVRSIKPGKVATWQIDGVNGPIADADQVVIATGAALHDLPFSAHLPLTPARGQISRFEVSTPSNMPRHVINGRHYVIPDGQSVVVGASFERNSTDEAIRDVDNQANLAGLSTVAPLLKVNPVAIGAHAGIRATTPDRLPVVGPLSDSVACADIYTDIRHGRKLAAYPCLPVHAGVFVLGGLGSRGIVTAPFAAHLLSDYMLGGRLIDQWAHLINPARFQIRQLKRGDAQEPSR